MSNRPAHGPIVPRSLAAIVCVGAAALTAVAAAAQGIGETPASAERPRLLVLFDGRVLTGEIAPVPQGYSVRQAGGTIAVPSELVRLTATSLFDAYEKQRNHLVDPTAEQHLELAEWCFRYRLYEQANRELEAALRLEPFRRDARELLQLIDAATSSTADDSSTQPQDGTRTSARLRPQTHADYVRRIQPLLMNKCGNAACHGSASENGLRLHNVRTGNRHQRLHSDENLSVVLSFIDSEAPAQSPLLLMLRDRDNGSHRGVFRGAPATEQLGLLRNWVHAAAADRRESPDGGSGRFDSPTAAHRQAADPEEAAPEDPSETLAPGSPRAHELLSEVLAEDQPDAFDPAEFNRRVHGRR